MTWVLKEKTPRPVDFYDLARSRGLLPSEDLLPLEIEKYKALARQASMWQIENPEHEPSERDRFVAVLIVSGVVPGDSADVDLVLNPHYFRRGEGVEPLRESVSQVFDFLVSELKVVRINAHVPATHGRTKKALKALGFKTEGKRRQAVSLQRGGRVDLYGLGLLADDWVKERERWVSSTASSGA